MKNLIMKSLKYQKGLALLPVIGALSMVGVMTVIVTSNLITDNEARIGHETDLNVLEYLDKSLSLASYFITNNLILCRDLDEGSWPAPIKKQCIWGGEKYSLNNDGRTVDLNFYGINDVSKGNDYLLEIPSGHNIFTNKENYSIRISFEIKDFKTDKSLGKIIGPKDSQFEYLDQDNKVILITATAQYKNKVIGEKNSLIRRPFATPVLSVENSAACNLVCTPGQSHNPNKECRSKNDVPRSYSTIQKGGSTEEVDDLIEGEKHVTLSIKNEGPGAIYKLNFFKKMKFNTKNYPEMSDRIETIDILANGESVLMPGKIITYEDKIPCLPPTQKTHVTRVTSSTRAGSRKTESSVHKEVYMDLSYGFNFEDENSDIIPRRLAEEVTTETSSTTRDIGVTKMIQYVSPPH